MSYEVLGLLGRNQPELDDDASCYTIDDVQADVYP